jgi:hypothetical protein
MLRYFRKDIAGIRREGSRKDRYQRKEAEEEWIEKRSNICYQGGCLSYQKF